MHCFSHRYPWFAALPIILWLGMSPSGLQAQAFRLGTSLNAGVGMLRSVDGEGLSGSYGQSQFYLGYQFNRAWSLDLSFNEMLARMEGNGPRSMAIQELEAWAVGPRLSYQWARLVLWSSLGLGSVQYLYQKPLKISPAELSFSSARKASTLGLGLSYLLIERDSWRLGIYWQWQKMSWKRDSIAFQQPKHGDHSIHLSTHHLGLALTLYPQTWDWQCSHHRSHGHLYIDRESLQIAFELTRLLAHITPRLMEGLARAALR